MKLPLDSLGSFSQTTVYFWIDYELESEHMTFCAQQMSKMQGSWSTWVLKLLQRVVDRTNPKYRSHIHGYGPLRKLQATAMVSMVIACLESYNLNLPLIEAHLKFPNYPHSIPCYIRGKHRFQLSRSPIVPFYPLGKGSPTKVD